MGYAPVGVFHAHRCPVVVSAVAEALGEQPIQLSAANADALGDAGHGKAVGHGGAHQRDRTHQVAAQVRPAAFHRLQVVPLVAWFVHQHVGQALEGALPAAVA